MLGARDVGCGVWGVGVYGKGVGCVVCGVGCVVCGVWCVVQGGTFDNGGFGACRITESNVAEYEETLTI